MTGLRRYEFSERLAEILGESRRDVRFRVTLLVTGGLVPPGPRGPGSPPASPTYAADLLIGVLAAPQQVHTVEAVRCYRALCSTALTAGHAAPGIFLGTPRLPPPEGAAAVPAFLTGDPSFGEALARLLDLARAEETRDALAREVFGVWVSRGFPFAAVQCAAWADGRRAVRTQRFEPAEGARPPAWLDPERGGTADPGSLHTVFVPVRKLIEIGTLTTAPDERKTAVTGLGQTIASLAQLAHQRRHRRPWKEYLAAAADALASAEKIDARAGRLAEVADFGSNPGNLRMLTYVPDDLPPDPALVVVLHGCTQTATSYDHGTGWSTLADRHGFAVLLPEQKRRNNPLRCFNWFRADDTGRNGGEPESIRQMIVRMGADHGIDRRRIYVTGVSAGGAMTAVMLATHPEMFAGGAIIAGVPYRSAAGLEEGFESIFQGRSRPAREWGDLVRAASGHRGPWPKVSIWHGDADRTVNPINATELIKQWTDVHGLSAVPTVQGTLDGHPRRVWQGANGEALVDSVTVAGMGHGVPIDPHGEDGCGTSAPFILDVGLSSSVHIARAWGLTEIRRPVPAAPRPPATASSAAPTGAPAAARNDEAPVLEGVIEAADRRDGSAAGRREAEGGVAPPPVPTGLGVDVAAIIGKSLEAAGLLKTPPPGAAGSGSSGAGGLGIDVASIIGTSLAAAGLVKDPGPRTTGAGTGGGPIPGIDVAAILSKSFEAAGLLRPVGEAPPDVGSGHEDVSASAPAGQGWQMLADERRTSQGGPVLYGHVVSGREGEVGNTVRTVSCRLALGDHPRLSYARRLDLKASANMITAASFRVLVDDVAVDEASAVGMDYAEAAWTERAGIDLAPFAGRTVVVTFEVAANANVYVEVCARAWVRDILIQDAAAEG